MKQSKTKDYYKILGIARNADKTEVKKAYKKKVRKRRRRGEMGNWGSHRWYWDIYHA